MSLLEGWATIVGPWAVESTVVGLVLLGVLRVAPGLSPGARVGVATLGLVKMLLPPVLLPVGPVSLGVAGSSGAVAPFGQPVAEAALGSTAIAWLAGVHLAGVLVASALLVRRAWVVARVRCGATLVTEGPLVDLTRDVSRRLGRAAPAVRVSDRCPVPLVTGAWSPTVILPARLVRVLGADEVRAIVGHEIAHLRSGDLWLGWLRTVARVLWWPSPVTRSLARAQVASMEERCDDLVVRRGLAPPPVYARSLVAAAETALHGRAPTFAAAAIGAHGLELRLRRLASPRPPGRKLPAWALLTTLTLLLIPTAFTGSASRFGWTTRILLRHSPQGEQSEVGATAPSLRHSHDHRHRR